MQSSPQDRHYLKEEADAFFERNRERFDPGTLRPAKRRIAEQIEACGIRPRQVLEFGCNYGDLLQHYAAADAQCHGVEPSGKAVEFGREHFGEQIELHQGTIADNPVSSDPARRGFHDLVIVDDVLCWVSRETLFQSLAHIDDALADGGHLFLREFFPLRNRRNRNHHVEEGEVFCYKPGGPHAAMFVASGMYAVVAQRVEMDSADAWADANAGDGFESRWMDTILRKSLHRYYE